MAAGHRVRWSHRLFSRVDICIDQHVRPQTTHFTGRPPRYVDLLVVGDDELVFVQIERIVRINDLTVITSDVVEAARSTLVLGDT